MKPAMPGTFSSPAARMVGVVYWTMAGLFGVVLLLLALQSLHATRSDDISFLFYLSWLMNEQGYAPYRDLFDTSFPGTFLLHALITALFGYGDTSFHLANITFFIALACMTWSLLRQIHARVAAAAILGFGLYYFTAKTSMFLQRDYLALLPALLALILARRESLSPRARAAGIGFLFALSASIKPHFAIGLPVVLLLSSRQVVAPFTCAAAGFLLWVIVCTLWLWQLDALGSFVDMATHYLPMYMSLDEQQNPSSYVERLPWMLNEYFASVSAVLIFAVAACIWSFFTNRDTSRRALTLALAVLMPLYVVYVVIGGRGWDYHWMPFMYFALCCVALFASPVASNDWRLQLLSLLPLGLLLNGLVYLSTRTGAHTEMLSWKNPVPALMQEDPATQDLKAWMQIHIKPGDRVQMMVTGTGGPLFTSLLDYRLEPATRYPLGLMFYQYADEPRIQDARAEFMQRLREQPPRFIFDNNLSVYVSDLKGKPDAFAEYDTFVAVHYKPVYDNRPHEPLPEKHLTVYEYQP